ncbi:RNA polymerase sigma factor [Paenibacillus lautus]|uniref:RNA polymerase sigma factor n=1 Tax=Paenibacillus lautus TaxID=1401 RepID=UPI003D9A1D3A
MSIQIKTSINEEKRGTDISPEEKVYRLYYHYLYRYIVPLIKDHSSIEDIIHDSFIKIMNHWPRGTVPDIAWIKRVVRNTALDHYRKLKKVQIFYDAEQVNTIKELDSHINTLDRIEEKIKKELLHQTINELKRDYRDLIKLFYFQGKSYKEISQELKLSEQVITQRLFRARKKLYHSFSKKW